MSPSSRRGLRIAILIAAAIGTVFWLVVCARIVLVPPAHRDGFEMLGAVLSTLYFLLLVLPTLVLGLLDRWSIPAAILAIMVIVVATDAVVPWFPWNLIQLGR